MLGEPDMVLVESLVDALETVAARIQAAEATYPGIAETVQRVLEDRHLLRSLGVYDALKDSGERPAPDVKDT